MKEKFLVILIILSLIATLIFYTPTHSKYGITAPGFKWYYVNDYNESDDCIYFKNKREYKFCGNYQIVTIKDDDENK